TSSDGRFSFKDIPPGEYRLAAARTGFIRSEYGQKGPNGRGLTIKLTEGQDMKDARVVLTQTGAISGVILDRKGVPMPTVQVLALKYGYRGPSRAMQPVKRPPPMILASTASLGYPRDSTSWPQPRFAV